MSSFEGEKWDVVFVANGMAEANIIVGRLETEGIPTRLEYEAVGALYGLTLDGLGQVRVTVPSEDAPRALDVLSRTYENGDLDWQEK